MNKLTSTSCCLQAHDSRPNDGEDDADETTTVKREQMMPCFHAASQQLGTGEARSSGGVDKTKFLEGQAAVAALAAAVVQMSSCAALGVYYYYYYYYYYDY